MNKLLKKMDDSIDKNLTYEEITKSLKKLKNSNKEKFTALINRINRIKIDNKEETKINLGKSINNDLKGLFKAWNETQDDKEKWDIEFKILGLFLIKFHGYYKTDVDFLPCHKRQCYKKG